MGKKIVVTPEQLKNAAHVIDGLAADYQKTITSLYTEIENMRSVYNGQDSDAYIAQVKGFQDDLQKMYKLMLDYSQFLNNSADAYGNVQSDIITQSGRLTN